jgi:hypothetical protein
MDSRNSTKYEFTVFHGKKTDVEPMNTEGIMVYWFIYIVAYLSIQEEDYKISMCPGQKE